MVSSSVLFAQFRKKNQSLSCLEKEITKNIGACDESGDQYEKIINQGLSTIGNQIWLQATTASGKMTAQSTPGICHPVGTRSVENTMIIANMRKPMTNASQKRRRMRGTSMKKLDRSTSFFVAPHVILYEKRCARSAWDR